MITSQIYHLLLKWWVPIINQWEYNLFLIGEVMDLKGRNICFVAQNIHMPNSNFAMLVWNILYTWMIDVLLHKTSYGKYQT